MSKFICCYLEESYGMTVYETKEEFVENFGEMFELDNFEEIISEMDGIYEVIEIKDDGTIEFILENGY